MSISTNFASVIVVHMKQFLFLLFIILASCGEPASSPATSTDTPSESSTDTASEDTEDTASEDTEDTNSEISSESSTDTASEDTENTDSEVSSDDTASEDTEDTASEDTEDTASEPMTDTATDEPNACDPTGGDLLFDPTRVASIELDIDDDALAILRENASSGREGEEVDFEYVPAGLTFDGAIIGEVGVRVKGSTTLRESTGDAIPLKIDTNRFTDGLKLDGVKKVNLHIALPELTYSDYLSYGAWRAFGMAAPRTGWAEVSLNGTALGLYTTVEQVNEDMLARYYENCMGDLYKPTYPAGNLAYRGDTIEDYENYNYKGDAETDHAAFLHFIDTINHAPAAEWSAVVDIESVIANFAGNIALGNFDHYLVWGHNYYLFESSPGRMTMLPWDMNNTQLSFDELCIEAFEERPLYENLIIDPEYEKMFFETLEAFLDGPGAPEALHQKLDDAVSLLGEMSPLSAAELSSLKSTITQRVDSLKSKPATTTTCVP